MDDRPDTTPEAAQHSTATPEVVEPATIFAALAQIIYADADLKDVYAAVCESAVALIPGCDHASLMLRRPDKVMTAAASSDVARRIDALEIELGEGPCVDAIDDAVAHVDADLTDGSAWPRLAARILAETPVRGTAGFRLTVEDRKVGALNLFSDTPGALSTEALDQAAVLAAFASVAMIAVGAQQSAQSLRDGIQSNREIGKAIGLLMAFHKVTDDEAFEILKRASQDMNLKVSAIAREVIDHHNRR